MTYPPRRGGAPRFSNLHLTATESTLPRPSPLPGRSPSFASDRSCRCRGSAVRRSGRNRARPAPTGSADPAAQLFHRSRTLGTVQGQVQHDQPFAALLVRHGGHGKGRSPRSRGSRAVPPRSFCCGTISPPILLKRDRRSVIVDEAVLVDAGDVAGDVPAVADDLRGHFRFGRGSPA